MIEILVLINLSKKISARAKSQGRSGVPFVLLLLALWIGGEFVGGFVVAILVEILYPNSESAILFAYLAAFVCAILGAVLAFKIVGPLETSPSQSRLEVRDRDLPILKERWSDRGTRPEEGRGARPDGDEKYRPGSP